jgi:predicted DNA binding CopG/RHH family protein
MQKEKDKRKKPDIVPDEFGSILEAADFWGSHDSAEYEDIMEPADFEVNIKRRICMVSIAEDILEGLRKKAIYQGLSTETLVNLLLQKHAL